MTIEARTRRIAGWSCMLLGLSVIYAFASQRRPGRLDERDMEIYVGEVKCQTVSMEETIGFFIYM